MECIEIYSDISSDSVQEVEPPRKLPPPVFDVESDDIVLNVNTKSQSTTNSVKKKFKKCDNEDESSTNESSNGNPSHWTNDMIKFYNDDRRGEEHFNVERLQAKMDKNPSLWAVSPRDLLFMKNRKIRSHVKCWNCCEFGHTVYQCKKELKLPKCYMCGGAGHIEKTCPCAVCLSCGNQMAIFVLSCNKCIQEAQKLCSRCLLFGHHFINCTDNWRKFHSTIGKTEIDIPQNILYKAPKEMWCCNCGKKGHHQIHCQSKKDLCFPETFPYVASYDTTFNQDIYSLVREGNIAAAAAAAAAANIPQRRRRENLHAARNKPTESKCMKNLNRLNNCKSQKKKRKKNKRKRNFIPIADFIPL